jgi:uncharacterized protein YndB with AHSA1/START domain
MVGTLALIAAASLAAADSTDLWNGKVDTGRSIQLEAIINASPEELFRVWSTEEGMRRILAPKLVIDPRLGGRYELSFAPEIDPEGETQGTKGSRILRWDPPRALAFEWATFVTSKPKGMPGLAPPPYVTPQERAAMMPYPVWVELSFDPLGKNLTRVRLASHGFRTGEKWDEALRYFWSNWALALGRLGSLFADRSVTADLRDGSGPICPHRREHRRGDSEIDQRASLKAACATGR